MLIVKRDLSRQRDEGQFYVALVDMQTENRFGYWCDQAHLRHMVHTVVRHFEYEIISRLLDPPVDPDDEVRRLRTAMAMAKGELVQTFTDNEHVQKAFEVLRDALYPQGGSDG